MDLPKSLHQASIRAFTRLVIDSRRLPRIITVNIQRFLTLTNSIHFSGALYYLTTLFGATAMYVFALNKGFEGAIPFLRRFFPNRTDTFYNRVDFFIVILAGSIIGTISFSPQSTLQALAAGFGWVGAMNVLMTPKAG